MYITDRPLEIDIERRGEATICRLAGSATMDVSQMLTDRQCPNRGISSGVAR